MTTVEDDDARMQALTALLDEIKIEENHGWIKAVVTEEGKVLFDFNLFCVPVCENRLMPFPEAACLTIDKEMTDRIAAHTWSRMAQMPLFTSLLMPAPTVATMMTGAPSRAHIEGTVKGLEGLERLYAYKLQEHGGDPVAFCQTDEARKIIDGALLAVAKRDMQLREYKTHVPVSWEPVVSSAAVYTYYSRLIDIITVTTAFTVEGSSTFMEQHQRIEKATTCMRENIDKAIKPLISESGLSPYLTVARNNVVGSRYLSVDVKTVSQLIERVCISYTYSVLAEMERWLLTVCEIPSELHASLMCTAQPKIGLNAGKLNEDYIRWQEDLRKLRFEVFPSVWHRYYFDEEFTDEEEVYINDPHLSRLEYKMAVFDALVRMTYDENTLNTLAKQYTSRSYNNLPLDEMSPVVAYPLFIYDTQLPLCVDCEEVFRE